MATGNLLCEFIGCGDQASVFGIDKLSKVRSCQTHVSRLLEKRMTILDVEGYYFVFSLEDAVEFKNRSDLRGKGRGNLTVLEANCDMELTTALSAIETARVKVLKAVESRFEEMKVTVTGLCEEAKGHLKLLEAELEQYVEAKEFRLSPAAELVCLDLAVVPRLVRFAMADASDSVSAVLSDAWSVASTDLPSTLKVLHANQKNEAVQSALAEAAERAKNGFPDALDYANSLIGEERTFDEAKDKVLSELLEFEKRKIERNWKWQRRFWDFRQRFEFSDSLTAEVGLSLASILYRQFGLFAEAEGILHYCLEASKWENPPSLDSMQLYNEMCGVYVASAQYIKAQLLGQWVLGYFGTANFPAEHYWTTLVYLAYSMGQNSMKEHASVILGDWWSRDLGGKSKLAEMLQLLLWGIVAEWGGSRQEAEHWLLQARRAGTSRFPTSPFTALALFRLTFVSEGEARERSLREAEKVYRVAAPKSIQAAMTLNHLGHFLQDSHRLREAEECYQGLKSALDVIFPGSILAESNLRLLHSLIEAQESVEASTSPSAAAAAEDSPSSEGDREEAQASRQEAERAAEEVKMSQILRTLPVVGLDQQKLQARLEKSMDRMLDPKTIFKAFAMVLEEQDEADERKAEKTRSRTSSKK